MKRRHPRLSNDGMTSTIEAPEEFVSGSARAARRRLMAVSLPIAALLLTIGEAVMPKGLDNQSSDLASVTKQVVIAGQHVGRFYVASVLIMFGLAALAVSFSAIATLITRRGAALATIAAVIGAVALTCGIIANTAVNYALAGAASAHPDAEVAGRMWLHVDSSAITNAISVLYFFGLIVATALAALALWRGKAVARWIAVAFALTSYVALFAGPGVVPGVPQSLPFVAVMIYLGVRVWRTTSARA